MTVRCIVDSFKYLINRVSILLILSSFFIQQSQGQTELQRDFVLGQIIVKLEEGVEQGAETMAMALGAGPLRTSGGELILDISNTMGFATMDREAKIRQTLQVVKDLNRDETVEYAQPNWILQHMVTPNDPQYMDQWH